LPALSLACKGFFSQKNIGGDTNGSDYAKFDY